MRRRWRALALAALLLAGCAAEPPPPVVLVSIDTLRADRLPAYGYAGVETPAIDALAADGLVFERAWSHYPLTLPSHASIFSGLLPPAHGVRDNSGYRLGGDLPHLARDLAAAGYATGGAVSAYVLRSETGVGDGFELYDDAIPMRPRTGLGGVQRGGGETFGAVAGWLAGAAAGERPFFLFLHLYEPHTPYAPPPPFNRYPSPYDGEIAAADAVVGRLLDELSRLGVYDRALVVLLSDHGEGLGDHGEAEHGVLLYREALQVPLVVKLPGGRRAGERVAAAAQLVDVYPTVAELAGLPARAGLAGRSLLSLTDGDGEREVYAETFYPRLHFGWSELASLVRGDLHYLHGPRPELFDLAADPGERRDLLAERRRDYAALRRATEALLAPLAPPAREDAETARRLAALGYLGGGAGADGDGPRPDPRSKLPLLADLQRGTRLAAADRFAEAAATLERVTAAEPAMVDAWEALARARRGLGEPRAALDAYRRALALAPEAPQLALGAATVLLDLGRPSEAADHARLALGGLPAEAEGLLARAALAEGDAAAAAGHAEAAVEAAPGSPPAHLLAAEVELAAGREEAALAAVERAARLAAGGPPVADLDRLRGHLLARRGRVAEAEAAFEREIGRFPAEPRAYTELALLHALEGHPRRAVDTLRRLVAAADVPRSYVAAVRTLRVLGDEEGAEALRRHALGRFPESPALRAMG